MHRFDPSTGYYGYLDDACDGYAGTLFEYWDELSVRRFLQGVLDDPVIRETAEIDWFAAEVARIDGKFRELLNAGFAVPGGGPEWWARRIPRVADEEMAQNVKDHFGIELEIG
ncbi:hypothetical protein [Streptomyces sp. 3214.6]|uniref:hypothetical protein n=1 Tax=Streptomyces sp. 3214.6 TaxID=1882757 RepID=UPI00090A1BD1|nr:hypothetical protein [Streptomyces sp. 3214.6]SHI25464.1 hypothetical protein SAMN05444521_6247 [Streptomyces sp. 3214.6]